MDGATVAAAVAVLATGLTAGLLYGFAHAVMPGLARVDDRTFIGAFQAVDRAILNPWFLIPFLGAPVAAALSALLHLLADRTAPMLWTAVALVLNLAVLVITGVVNVPLNNALQAEGPPATIRDPAGARARFEARWVRWNVVRTLASVAALGALAVALAVS